MKLLNSPIILFKNIRIILAAIILIPIFLLIDSPTGDFYLGNGQYVANVIVGLAFIAGLCRCNKRARHVMLLGIVIGLCGEILFSLVLNMYHYRMGNIPLWVAFGHGMIFGLVYRVSRKKLIIKNELSIQRLLITFAIVFSTYWLFKENDVFGFICTLVFLFILCFAKNSKTFFLMMFTVVVYIELVGTATQCWWWPDTLSGLKFTPSSGNPPSGIAVFYFLFDIAVFWLYLNIFHTNIKLRYNNIKQLSI